MDVMRREMLSGKSSGGGGGGSPDLLALPDTTFITARADTMARTANKAMDDVADTVGLKPLRPTLQELMAAARSKKTA